MKTKLSSWPDGTEEIVSHAILNAYIQKISVISGIHSLTIYNTSVVDVRKSGNEWRVQTVTLAKENGVAARERYTKNDWVRYTSSSARDNILTE